MITSDGTTSFLGYGLTRPLQRGSSDFVAAGGPRLVNSALGMIVGTKPGDWRWRPAFGTDLEPVRHKNMNEGLEELARQIVAGAIARYEPRIKLTDVRTSIGAVASEEETTLRETIRWEVIDVNSPTNQVLLGPYDTTETV